MANLEDKTKSEVLNKISGDKNYNLLEGNYQKIKYKNIFQKVADWVYHNTGFVFQYNNSFKVEICSCFMKQNLEKDLEEIKNFVKLHKQSKDGFADSLAFNSESADYLRVLIKKKSPSFKMG